MKELICPTCGAPQEVIKDLEPQPEGPVPGPILQCTACGETGSEDHFTSNDLPTDVAEEIKATAGEQSVIPDDLFSGEPAKPVVQQEITEEMSKAYVADHGNECPFCHSSELEYVAEYHKEEEDRLDRPVTCGNCNKTWTEVFEYRLLRIEVCP